MILLLDNYDSFSYNLVQMIGCMNPDIQVARNDAVTVRQIEELDPSHLILSPGPGYPGEAGVLEQAVRELKGRMPILGVCLGHQGICEAFGGTISHAKRMMHGKQSKIRVDNSCPIFAGMPSEIMAARYHSLIAGSDTLPKELKVVARDCGEGEVMAVQHRDYPIFGLQFHPESILTPDGRQILENFLSIGQRS